MDEDCSGRGWKLWKTVSADRVRRGYVVSLAPLVAGVWAGTEEVEACL